MERRLGRGLGSLLSATPPTEPRTEIEISQVRPNPYQPRKTFDPAALQSLQASIERLGLLQPVVVRPALEGFELISGERRWRAARAAGHEMIPAVIRSGVRDEEMLELALVENLQREDLDPIERARGFKQLQEGGLTQEQVATRVGLQRSTVTNHVRLLELPEDVQKAVARGLLSMGHARALLGLREHKAIRALMRQTIRRELSVREVERRVRKLEHPRSPHNGPSAAPPPWIAEIEMRLRESLGTKVCLQNNPGYRGQIVIDYYDRPSLDSLIARLAPRATL